MIINHLYIAWTILDKDFSVISVERKRTSALIEPGGGGWGGEVGGAERAEGVMLEQEGYDVKALMHLSDH